jgi:hypothetical protein
MADPVPLPVKLPAPATLLWSAMDVLASNGSTQRNSMPLFSPRSLDNCVRVSMNFNPCAAATDAFSSS